MTKRAGLANVQPPPAPAEPGNTRAMKHGLNSERALAPIREKRLGELRGRFRFVDDPRLTIQANRLARIELATRYLDEKGLIRNRRTGETWAIVNVLIKDEQAAERTFQEWEREAAGRDGDGALNALQNEGRRIREKRERRALEGAK